MSGKQRAFLAPPPLPPTLPFCQVMAGRGAPEVSQCRMTEVPSITALSAGPAVMLGAMPETVNVRAHAHAGG